jgi:5-(carboxyamino)imidazole ribonucleotide synthase
MIEPILPGATLGVLGGGQLGRMFVHAAQRMGYCTAVLDPDPASPAGLVAHHHVRTPYLDEHGLAQLMRLSAAITTEFENVPAAALTAIAAQRPVAPGAEAVSICQHRAAEKEQFRRSAVACAPHAVIETPKQLADVDAKLLPGVLKTCTLGYDGKGQQRVATRAELEAAWDVLQRAPCVLEQQLPLKSELSVIVARNAAGDCVHFPVQQNLHRAGILAVTAVPARGVGDKLQQQAVEAAQRIAHDMHYVGVMCVEFFVLDDGSLVANEMAPRPHNSGHYTIDACDVSQFELQVRALAGLPLAAPRLHSPAVMLNLLGELWLRDPALESAPAWAEVLSLPGTHLHLYGKPSVQRGRKMGHLTITAASSEDARATALEAAALLGIEAF